jgi:uncharacterized SAM-binding protein YcdF (DUF218 family)
LLVTFDLLREGRADYAVISGGNAGAPADTVEARVLAKQLTDWGIAPERVVIEDTARNTRENAVEIARIVRLRGWTKVLMITSAWHMPRSLDCFRAVKLDVDTLPVDYRSYDSHAFPSHWLPRANFLDQSSAAIRELAGRVIYRIQGYGVGP